MGEEGSDPSRIDQQHLSIAKLLAPFNLVKRFTQFLKRAAHGSRHFALIAGKSDRIAKPLGLSPKNAISQRLVRFAIAQYIHFSNIP